jgi:hypothetical protein
MIRALFQLQRFKYSSWLLSLVNCCKLSRANSLTLVEKEQQRLNASRLSSYAAKLRINEFDWIKESLLLHLMCWRTPCSRWWSILFPDAAPSIKLWMLSLSYLCPRHLQPLWKDIWASCVVKDHIFNKSVPLTTRMMTSYTLHSSTWMHNF